MEHLLRNHQQQVVAYGNPDLRIDFISRCSVERLDVQASLYELEERLHVPSFAVKLCNGKRREPGGVSDESVDIICRVVLVDHHAYPFWIIRGCLDACEDDILVTDDARTLVHLPVLYHLILHVVLCPRDEECVLLVEQSIQSLEVYISLIHKVICECLDRQLIHYLAVMYPTFRNMDECRYASPEAEQGVHLDGTLPMVELCPRAQLEAELYGAAVKGIDHIVNVEAIVVFVIKFSRLLHQIHGKVMIDTPVLLLVQVRQRGTGDEGQTRMIQLAFKGCKCCLVSAQALLGCELGETHHHELVTTGVLDLVTVAFVPCDTLAKYVLWKQRHDLCEYTFTLIHLICSLHYYQMQRYKFKSSKKYSDVNHWKQII